LEFWAHRVKPSKGARDKADEWLQTVELMGPDMIPHVRRTVLGLEERTSIFSDVDLVISYRVAGYPSCTIGIIEVSSTTEYEEGRGKLT
jgi:hypothetical protein